MASFCLPRRVAAGTVAVLAATAVLAVTPLASAATPTSSFDPNAFTSLGTFTATPGTYTVDTDALTLNGSDASFTGVDDSGTAVFDFDSISIPAGATVVGTGSKPFALLSRGGATLDGSIVADGASVVDFDTSGVPGGPGGGAGGDQFANGGGPGGGAGAVDSQTGSTGGGFGGAGARGGGATGAAGAAYGDLAANLDGGSGGGGGDHVTGGGGGGGVALVAAGDLALGSASSISANGGGGAVGWTAASSGGSGGGILVEGSSATLDGALRANGGDGGAGGCCAAGGGGGGGRIFVHVQTVTYSSTLTTTAAGGTSDVRDTGECGCAGSSSPAAIDATGGPGSVIIQVGAGAGTTLPGQSITFTSTPPSSPVVGDTYTATATGGGSGNPVTFSADPALTTNNACTVAPDGSVTFTHAGRCVINADQAGNGAYAPAPTAQQTIEVGKAAQAISFTSTPPASPVVGDTYTATADGGSSGNPVTFSLDPASTSNACSVNSAGAVTFNHVGTCLIDANQAGNGDYTAAPQQQQSIAVGQTTQTITITSTAPAAPVAGDSYTVTATGGGSGKPVTFSVDPTTTNGACTVTSAGAVTFRNGGTCVIAAHQAGTADYAAAPTVTQSVAVGRAATKLSLNAPDSAAAHSPLTLVVGVTSTPVTAPVPTGSVVFADGTTTLGTVPLDGSGNATLSLPDGLASVGGHSVTATYAGDGAHTGSSAAHSVEITPSGSLALSLDATQRSGGFGRISTITGTVTQGGSPLSGVRVQIVLVRPTGAVVVSTLTSRANGSFSGSLSPVVSGVYVARATVAGVTVQSRSVVLSRSFILKRLGTHQWRFTGPLRAGVGGVGSVTVTDAKGRAIANGTIAITKSGYVLTVPSRTTLPARIELR